MGPIAIIARGHEFRRSSGPVELQPDRQCVLGISVREARKTLMNRTIRDWARSQCRRRRESYRPATEPSNGFTKIRARPDPCGWEPASGFYRSRLLLRKRPSVSRLTLASRVSAVRAEPAKSGINTMLKRTNSQRVLAASLVSRNSL
jgi:hypothetical protein